MYEAPQVLYRDSLASIHMVAVGPLDNRVYVVRCEQTGTALLIDAANEHDRLLALCTDLGVRHVVETHGHWDHIGAVEPLRDAGFDVGIAAADSHYLPSYDQILDDDTVLTVGKLGLRTIHTPGHTPGSMCFALVDYPIVFSGDTLFPGGPGNCTFEGGNFTEIIDSIDHRLFGVFPPETLVYPGHGDATTIGAESPQLDTWVERGW